MPTTVNIHEAKTHLSRLIERVAEGEEIVIARAGRPVAELRAYSRPDLVFGSLAGEISYDAAFSPETERDVAALFDDELGLVVGDGTDDHAPR